MNTDVEDLLREGMERFTADLRAPAGLTRLVARRHRRRVVLRSMTAGAAALAAGAVALAMAVLPVAGHGIDGSAVDAAYVVKHVTSALSAAEPGEIAQMKVTTIGPPLPGGTAAVTTSEEWSNGGQWRAVLYSPAGHQVFDEGFSTASGFTLVSYPARTWTREPGLGRSATPSLGSLSGRHGCGPAVSAFPLLFRLGLPGTSSSASSLPTTVATALRTAVSCGTLAVAGRQRIDGIEAIELTSRPSSLIAETIWVSPDTFLPVRVVVRSAPSMPVFQQTADFTWLPPTARNLAKLTVPIPAGFRKVSLREAVLPIVQVIPAGTPKPTAICPSPAGRACKNPAALPIPPRSTLPTPRLTPLSFSGGLEGRREWRERGAQQSGQ
jgi:hypothetical protein